MTGDEFAGLLNEFTLSAESGDGARFASHFTDDAVPVLDDTKGYAWSLSSFVSKIPQFKGQHVVIDGISRFVVRDGLVAEYRESVNGGVAMAQLGVEPDRMAKVFKCWTGWLKERPETMDYLARPKGSRAKSSV